MTRVARTSKSAEKSIEQLYFSYVFCKGSFYKILFPAGMEARWEDMLRLQM